LFEIRRLIDSHGDPHVKRREFLRTAGGVSLASVLGDFVGASEPAPLDVGSLFEANSPEVLALAKRVMEKCVLEKIMPPTPPLKNTWIVPGGPYYQGQWIWDTMFVVDLLSILPDQKQVIRDIFENYWDFQDRWNQKMPDGIAQEHRLKVRRSSHERQKGR
jgi:hypothetical protein